MASRWRLGLAAAVCVAAAGQGDAGLTDGAADRFAALALRCARQEYPNKLDHVMNGAAEVQSPRALHPAFYGCFDWHSSVHGHWMLVRLLRTHPGMARAADIRAVLDENLTPESIAAEVAYFAQPGRRSFERTYGWAWLLKLAAELRSWDAPEAQRWAAALQPLADRVAAVYLEFLPKQTYPIRTGVHPNSAFSLDLALDYARAANDGPLEAVLLDRARTWFGKDRRGPLVWEPGGEDFLSPCLEEAALMAKVLPPRRFAAWLDGFLPGLPSGLAPAEVSDRTDPKIVHLDGLNLSRARALYALARTFGPKDPRRAALMRSAERHSQASLPHLASGSYEGEHWLATFAVRMLEEARAEEK
ncbi:DUF2891 domain-containing protein [Geothrix sp. 21YS21S-4]|uniref:DUF2891 domain-containing protein n=1 Tax=Geothrix sp. 21YS21S-4 TaxID=3068889 RepID=UPI0027B9D838|nr:DUF2891 domain-containing protein [Geothrix sp. 21YS21S-4]